jgi:hypothetical protein
VDILDFYQPSAFVSYQTVTRPSTLIVIVSTKIFVSFQKKIFNLTLLKVANIELAGLNCAFMIGVAGLYSRKSLMITHPSRMVPIVFLPLCPYLLPVLLIIALPYRELFTSGQ